MELNEIILPLASALLYSLIWFCKSVIDPQNPTKLRDFKIVRLISTLIVGLGVAIVMILSGFTLSQENMETQLFAYSFVIAAVEQVGTAIYNYVQAKRGV